MKYVYLVIRTGDGILAGTTGVRGVYYTLDRAKACVHRMVQEQIGDGDKFTIETPREIELPSRNRAGVTVYEQGAHSFKGEGRWSSWYQIERHDVADYSDLFALADAAE